VTAPPKLWFDRGTLRLAGPPHSLPPELPQDFAWDEHVGGPRAPAFRYGSLARSGLLNTAGMVDDLAPSLGITTGPWQRPPLRPYQEDALDAFRAFDRQGVVALPTGSGKTRVAIAAMAEAARPSLVLCPTRALLADWERELARWYGGSIGVVGDGARHVELVTVMTFESAYRHLDRLGDRFAVLVVDEAHHFGGGLRSEALEMCVAPIRLGLTATAPAPHSDGEAQLRRLIGPVVCEVGISALAGKHLAELEIVRVRVQLDADERADYERSYRPFAEARAAHARFHPRATWQALLQALALTESGRMAIRGFHRAVSLASFPRAKRALASSLPERHRGDKTLVFTAHVEDAYTIALDNLVPAITAEVSRAEREDLLLRFRDGRARALVSARVLNEGIDVPDASVAIIVGGTLGPREHVQRLGRILRPSPGKRALAYELVTADTIDDRRAQLRSTKGSNHAPPRSAHAPMARG